MDRKELIWSILSHHLEGVARAEFTLVLHTKLGEASVLANVVDSNKDEWILGTVAEQIPCWLSVNQHAAKVMEERLLRMEDR